MLKEFLPTVDIPLKCALRDAVVRSAIFAILIQERRQCGRPRLISPRRYTHAKRSQCVRPGVKRAPGGITTSARALPPVQPGPRIITRKAQRSGQCQLICFDQLALAAVSPEPPYPIKINLDRSPRKVASPPQLNHRAFAVITTSHIHAIL